MGAKLAVLISGRGSNMQCIVNACEKGDINAEVCLVASDRADAGGLAWAAQRGIATAVINPKDYQHRDDADKAMAAQIKAHGSTHLLLAGYMRILSEEFVAQFSGRALNIHPSLLPKYKGLNSHARALAAGDQECGATVHFVSAALDSGPAVIQAKVMIEPSDDAETLAAKVLCLEHIIYPKATQWLVTDRLVLEDNKARLDNQLLETPRQYSVA